MTSHYPFEERTKMYQNLSDQELDVAWEDSIKTAIAAKRDGKSGAWHLDDARTIGKEIDRRSYEPIKKLTWTNWKLILHGTEKYPFPLSIVAGGGRGWITRDGVVDSLDHARLIVRAVNAHDMMLAALIDVRDNVVSDDPDIWDRVDAAIAKGQEGL